MRRWIVSVVGLVLAAGGAAAQESVDRTVKANARTAVGGIFTFWQHSCEQSMIPDPKLSKAPANGRVEIEKHRLTMRKPHPCDGRELSGPVFFYTPAKGFKGVDQFTVEYPFSTNDVSAPIQRSSTYRITVQ